MKINSSKIALASALAMGIFYAIGALLFYIWPAITLKLSAQLMFLTSLGPLAPLVKLTLINFSSALIQSMVYTYIFVWIWAEIYNKLTK